MNDVLKTNLDGIEALMKHYHAPRKKSMNKIDVMRLMTKDSDVLMGEKEVMYCIGMSKMTVVKESVTPRQYDIV